MKVEFIFHSFYQKSPPRQLGNKNNTQKKRVANYDNSFFVRHSELFIRHAEFFVRHAELDSASLLFRKIYFA